MNRDFLHATGEAVRGALTLEKWVQSGKMVMCSLDLETRQAIVAAGEDEFVRLGHRGFNGQGYRTQDLREIYQAVFRKTVRQGPVTLN